MDYKEEYQKALERAKKGLPIDEVFPELKESEDERIRKFLVELISNDKANNFNGLYEKRGVRFDDVLAYPEKQKENPKSADSIPSDCVSDAKCEDRWHKVTDSLPDNGRLVLAKDCLGNVLLARFDGENWEVNVYDNEDHYCHNSISNWCEIPSEKQKEPLTPEEKMNHPLYLEGFDVGKKVGETLKEQKPAEWSKEDEKMLTGIIERGSSRVPPYEPALREEQMEWLMNRLKSLRPQPKQEWTGATVEQVETIATHLDNLGNTAMAEILRSIHPQPHWKPSEEQMKCLDDCVNRAREVYNASTSGYDAYHTLRSLYHDLQKLL